MEKVFERWKHRHLTLFGKVLIIKSLATSKLIHVTTILHTPEEILKDIEKLIFSFLWESTDRIKRKTLIGSKQNGGIKMLDIFCKNKALKASWAPRIAKGGINSFFPVHPSPLITLYQSDQGLHRRLVLQQDKQSLVTFCSIHFALALLWCFYIHKAVCKVVELLHDVLIGNLSVQSGMRFMLQAGMIIVSCTLRNYSYDDMAFCFQ